MIQANVNSALIYKAKTLWEGTLDPNTITINFDKFLLSVILIISGSIEFPYKPLQSPIFTVLILVYLFI